MQLTYFKAWSARYDYNQHVIIDTFDTEFEGL